jgi:hypothetical protein
VCDLIYWLTGNTAWSVATLYLLGAALVMAAFAAVAGFTDFFGEHRIRQLSAAPSRPQHCPAAVACIALSPIVSVMQGLSIPSRFEQTQCKFIRGIDQRRPSHVPGVIEIVGLSEACSSCLLCR